MFVGRCSVIVIVAAVAALQCSPTLAFSPVRKAAASRAELPTQRANNGVHRQRLQPLRSELPISNDELAVNGGTMAKVANGGATAEGGIKGIMKKFMRADFLLLSYFAFWYLGNYYYNLTNKIALKAAGGAAGFPALISTAQLGVGVLYSAFLWLAPDARKVPRLKLSDIVSMLPVGFCMAFAHGASVLALSAGTVSFGQIVKACEPAFAAVIGVSLYSKTVSTARWVALIPVILGVVIASVSELSFSWVALISACTANTFAAFKANENKRLMDTEGIRDRLGSVGNQFAVTTLLSFLISVPFALAKEGGRIGEFIELAKTNPVIMNNMLSSGLLFYLYNEMATLTIKKTGAVTASVANTAKRVIVIIGVAIALNEPLSTPKLVGSAICIAGVLLYSNADTLFPGKKAKAT
mmetsp:Transcript_27926/g.88970  ORF Transcript_27926/g.88970 Transcript_27926/m.88970 type:complete len:411 (-) Transcript_27926:277-1509(-)